MKQAHALLHVDEVAVMGDASYQVSSISKKIKARPCLARPDEAIQAQGTGEQQTRKQIEKLAHLKASARPWWSIRFML